MQNLSRASCGLWDGEAVPEPPGLSFPICEMGPWLLVALTITGRGWLLHSQASPFGEKTSGAF